MANYRDLLEQAGARYGVPEGLMTALGAKESSYNPAAVSSAGAVGLTQVMPGTWRDMGYTDEQMQNPEYQADAGARYLAKMYQQFGNWRDALQAYHDGPGNVMKAKRGEYTLGPEGRGYVDDRFAQWAGDPVTDSTVEQRATSAKVHPQQDPNNPFAQLEAQSSEQVSASGVQSDPNNPFAQIEQQAASQQPPQPVSSVAPKPVQQQGGIMSDLGNGLAETGRGLLQAGINVANIPAELTDAVTSAAAWAGGKLGIGDGTYQPAPRVTTQGLEQDFGLQQGALTPQTTEGRVFAEALPYLTPAGVERAATQSPTLAGRIAQGATRLLAENAVGSLAANSAKDDAEALATDLGVGVLAGGAITLRKYQQANAVYADEAAKLKNTRLKNVLMKGDLTPEVVNNMLFSKNKSEIKTLYNSVGRVGRAQMRNGIIGKAMEKSGGSPDQFLRQLNILQNQTGITFKGQDAAYLKGLKNYLQSTQQAAKAAVTTPTGQQTIPFIIGYGTAMNPATTGAAVSYGLLTRAYESEPFRNAMLRMANTPRGSTAFEKAMQQAQKAINALTQGAKSDALSE
ncbi:lytic transglycosylase domain-containing protein [Escherichia coli O19:H7]|uniref:lytic transglycosylase domain-containing protein n=1 Tax=Escherichia coli TaxID=562 RepID=UPI0002A451B0|nr:lytic transglycosylase domain-containing protein [Escherichia coli]EEW2381979.1 lytic transglycosylase domain-containing protein [Escherichia coli]EFB4722566.1 lytic transglycosylase domain-containing protein [Escherichia coli]EFN4249531.1 lytic transglycosylase domain-containing protein [Escherichia coli]EFN4974201.1 lytic transglycosylase domain-containing protein [Escherichia coli]EFN5263550.1 lytic transglycosylase domain-containing protein [Escherichia coli]